MSQVILRDDKGHFRKPDSIVEFDAVKVLAYLKTLKFSVQKEKIVFFCDLKKTRVANALRFLRRNKLVGVCRSNKKYYWGYL